MNRLIRTSVMFAAFFVFAAGAVFAQGTKGMIESKAWYVDTDKKIREMSYWRVYLGDYDIKLKRNYPGEGQIEIAAGMNFQLFPAGPSKGFIEGNGQSIKGKVSSLPGMRIVSGGGEGEEVKMEEIDYIYDYGTKVALKDGRKGNFMIGAEGGGVLEIKRFQLSEYTKMKGRFGEEELKEVKDRVPVIGISFTKEGATRAASEATSD
ncbi:MAG: hypothetical protein LBB74_00720 [Chitinispirillales bacterium]|nr:hypothetical protein [Chitinispirillales bacterium]